MLNLQRSRGNAVVARGLGKPPAAALLAREVVVVPFNGIRRAGEGDTLITTGLMNCVAVTAFDPVRRVAVMAHADTLNVMDDEPYRQAADLQLLRGEKSAWRRDTLLRIRDQMVARLSDGGRAPAAIEWHVAVGKIWMGVDTGKEDERRAALRHSLILALHGVFGVEVASGGETAVFPVAPESRISHPVNADEALPSPDGDAMHSGSGHPEMHRTDADRLLNYGN